LIYNAKGGKNKMPRINNHENIENFIKENYKKEMTMIEFVQKYNTQLTAIIKTDLPDMTLTEAQKFIYKLIKEE
jgi:hypothetical protein